VSTRRDVLKKIRAIPPMSHGALELVRLLQKEDTGIEELVEKIRIDPGLTTNLLAIANSAHFGFPREVHSVREAVLRIGTKQVFRQLMASLATPWMAPRVKGYDLPPNVLWQHSVATAVAAEELASALRIECPPCTYTAALLHDIGKIALGTYVQADAAPIMELAFQENLSFEVAERQVMGIDHAEVGSALLDRWRLPMEIVEVVRWHHDPDAKAGDKLVVDLTHAADMLTLSAGMGLGCDALNYRFSEGSGDRLGLKPDTLETVGLRTLDALGEMIHLFGRTEQATGKQGRL